MLSVQDVTKRYGGTVACEHITLSVPGGNISILLGPNGAGKSTLIKCIAGLLRFDGAITVGGFHCKSVDAKRLLGYVPEVPAVYDLLTVEEHLEFVSRAFGLTEKEREFGEYLLDRFELTDKRNKLGKELSKGMQQKLSICCALVHRPRLIIFDEPLVGLDPHAIKQLKNIFVELKQSGVTVIISTHMIDSVENYWDTAHIMINGRCAATLHNGEGSLEELFFRITEGGVPYISRDPGATSPGATSLRDGDEKSQGD